MSALAGSPKDDRDVAEVCTELGFEMLGETADLIESLAISLRESVFRRDCCEARLHVRRLRLAVNATLATVREMNGEQPP
jgi:hypothetical protein